MEIEELIDFPRASPWELPTLGQLLNFKFDGDTSEDDGDGSETPATLSFSNLPTLGQFLNFKLDGDTSEDDGDGSEKSTPATASSSQRFVLSFSNLTYSVKIRPKMTFSTLFSRSRKNHLGSPENKTLLDDISGEARDGEILAVMGASGSGKSTLIDALANRIAKGSLKGSVKLNGETLESLLLKVISAYVMQDDLLFPMLTVEETLMFAAEFRLPRTISKSNKKKRVQALIDQLDLKNAARTVIGDEGHRGISGGERRRVSIGIDIVHDPVVFFLDEPTSGLDSTSAFMVVKVLQRIARTGSIVIMSIHQPSSRIIGLLDRLILLSRGKAVFSGSITQLSLFFAEFGVSIPENENHTETEFILDQIHELEEGSSSGITNLVEFNKSWQSRNNLEVDQIQHVKSLKEAIKASMISRGKLASNTKTLISNLPTFATPFWIEITNLTKRSLTNSRRTSEEFGARFAAVLLTGFILATVFWQLDDSPKGLQERFGFFAFAMSTTFYTSAQALPVFIQERQIFIRETSHNTYRRFSYLISLLIVSLPPLIFLSLTFATTTFWALGLDGGLNGFLFYFLAVFASFWSAISFVTFLSGVIPNVMVGFTVVVKTLAYFLLFSGFFINRDKIPNYWVWFHYLSLVKYPYESVLQNEFGDSEKCFVRGVQIFDNTPLKGVPEFVKMKALENLRDTLARNFLNVNFTSETCFAKGEDVLRQNGITELKKWKCLLVTVGWGFWFWTLFYFLLLRSKNKRR